MWKPSSRKLSRKSQAFLFLLVLSFLFYLGSLSSYCQSPALVKSSATPSESAISNGGTSSPEQPKPTNKLLEMTHDELLSWATRSLAALEKLTIWYNGLKQADKDYLTELPKVREELTTLKDLSTKREEAYRAESESRDKYEAALKEQILALTMRVVVAETKAKELPAWALAAGGGGLLVGGLLGAWAGSSIQK